jgi:hypothetical protein
MLKQISYFLTRDGSEFATIRVEANVDNETGENFRTGTPPGNSNFAVNRV